MVEYSIHRFDLSFAGTDRSVQNELFAFKDHLKSAKGPPSDLSIEKFLAKGTQGWVFLGHWNEADGSKRRVAVKIVRMTQALGGVKEWYVSKRLKAAGLSNIVFTSPNVYVIERSKAQPVVEEQIREAGPVEHYVCLIQEFMDAGSLEAFAESESCTTKRMFMALQSVASTLAAMHKVNIQHRDVKPENVMLEKDGDEVV